MNKKVAVLMLSFIAAAGLFAKDVTERSVGAENSWQESISLDGKSSGKYNIVVTATDIAGNQSVAGPFNVFVDPESDLPVTGITNPAFNMQVPGNLNIVGTCVDDDGVDHVNLIFDGDRENVVTANGAEFWSYYLDTTALTEGPHTIEVYGTDINGLEGHSTKITWQLNRKNPETIVGNPGMGTLVSGKISLTGYVKDGNGIKSLEYSIDGGQHYKTLKLKETKLSTPDADGATSHYAYSLPIDTTKFQDGPAICWFKGIDNAGSVGYYAFLYFVDNTSPKITIVSPAEGEPQNGIFTISGYAKDTNGMKSLSWQWGNEKGDFDLVAGNPYWVKEINSIGLTKPQTFTISGTDTMGNVVTVTRTITFDQDADKPVVTINSPAVGLDVDGSDGSLFVRGIVTDDDGLAEVVYKLDNGTENHIQAQGVFYAEIPGTLSSGTHILRVYGIDKYGVKGNTVAVNFTSTGVAPEFTSATLKTGRNSVEYIAGTQINPESDSVIEIPVTSSVGLANVTYELTWGTNGIISGTVPVTGVEKKATVSIPVTGEEFPWGVSKLTVKATDSFNRTSSYGTILNVKNLTRSSSDEPAVYFTDSNIAEDGTILLQNGSTVTGYFAGAVAKSVTTVPAVRNVTATLTGNVITLTSTGATDAFAVRVTTTTGATYTSKQLHFVASVTPPVLTINNNSVETGVPVDFASQTSLSITGTVTSATDATVRYRVLAAQANVEDGVVVSSEVLPVVPVNEATPVTVDRRGNFTLNFKASDFVDGVSVVEIIASNASGVDVSKAVVVNNTPAKRIALSEEEVIPPSAAPAVYWMQGIDWYAVCVYQGNVDNQFKYVKASDIRADAGKISFTAQATDVDAPVPVTATAAVSKKGTIKARFLSIDGKAYQSGMDYAMNRNSSAEEGHTITVFVDSTAAVVSAEWTISGADVPGGTVTQKGKGNLLTVTEGSQYQFEIPLANLPARLTDITAVIKDSTGTEEVLKGTINVVRRHDAACIDDTENVYIHLSGKTVFDAQNNRYILDDGSELLMFANIDAASVTPGFTKTVDGLSAVAAGKLIKVTATKDGSYSAASVKAVDAAGGTVTSSAFNAVADTSKPEITITSPVNMGWVKNQITLTGTVTDGNGITSLAYSIFDEKPAYTVEVPGEVGEDGIQLPSTFKTVKDEPEWKSITVGRNGAFSLNISTDDMEEGYIPLNIRAVDGTGKENIVRLVVQKDTVAPEVTVILPDEGAKVNGENLMVFSIKDAGAVKNIVYTSQDKKTTHTYSYNESSEDDTASAVTLRSGYAMVGTDELPIANGMNFTFTDEAGNSTSIGSWPFAVDSESDAPIAEVHMPEDNAVITTDFTVSGIVYDDDGACRVWFKMDDGDYMLISEEYSSSYKINIPLAAMTDNEHTVTVQAEDIHGTRGPEFQRTFRISLEEPKGSVDSPSFDQTVNDFVTIRGKATDKNGINKVQISLDNGASYNDAEGTEDWSYTFDTHVIEDGTHVVFIKIWDGYDITGLYSSLINIDNTAPELRLELPLDDSTVTGDVFFSGQTTDNIGLTNLFITVRSFDSKIKVPDELARIELTPDEIISQKIDLSGLQNGFYNVELTGTDAANNITRVSRNIELNKDIPDTKVGILYPLNGEHVQSVFNVYGTVSSIEEIESVDLYIDDVLIPGLYGTEITESGYYKFRVQNVMKQKAKKIKDDDGNIIQLEAEEYVLEEGNHTYKVIATTSSGKTVTSNEQSFIYSKYGPWVTLDNFIYGDFATNRPQLKGDAGYVLTPEEQAALKDKNTPSEVLNAIRGKKIKQVYMSFDNGKTYEPVSSPNSGSWKYRIENQDIAAGNHFMVIKAEMLNGECAVTRLLIQIDRTSPTIKLISPGEGGRYNQSLSFEGLTSDDVQLKDVTIALRKGDKATYEVPGFIQGLYFDASVWGATLYNVGIGLTAFDNAVKIQANFGQFTRPQWDFVNQLLGNTQATGYRFGGNVIGAKIIAQIGYLPFSFLFGHDFDWLSASVAVGANFSWFSESGAIDANTGLPISQVLSSAMMQIEFPRFTISNQRLFKTWAFYAEPQLWFIPSDIASDDAHRYVFTYSFGLHVGVF